MTPQREAAITPARDPAAQPTTSREDSPLGSGLPPCGVCDRPNAVATCPDCGEPVCRADLRLIGETLPGTLLASVRSVCAICREELVSAASGERRLLAGVC